MQRLHPRYHAGAHPLNDACRRYASDARFVSGAFVRPAGVPQECPWKGFHDEQSPVVSVRFAHSTNRLTAGMPPNRRIEIGCQSDERLAPTAAEAEFLHGAGRCK